MIGFGGLWRIFFFIFFTSILGCPFYFRGLSRSFGLLRIKHPHPVPNKCKSPTKPWFILWGVFNIYIYYIYFRGMGSSTMDDRFQGQNLWFFMLFHRGSELRSGRHKAGIAMAMGGHIWSMARKKDMGKENCRDVASY